MFSPIFAVKTGLDVFGFKAGLNVPSDHNKLFSKSVRNLLSKLFKEVLAPGYNPTSEITPAMSCGIVALYIAV